MRHSITLHFALALALAAGCSASSGAFSGDDGGAGPGGDDPSNADGALGSATDGGKRATDARVDARRDGELGADTAPTGPLKIGQITAGQTITIVGAQTFYSSYASASFYETPPSSGGPSCAHDQFGACEVYDCNLAGPKPDAGAPRYAGAGTVHLTSDLNGNGYTISTTAGSYTSVSSQSLLYEEGSVLTLSSTGAEVPAFSNKTLIVPGGFTVSQPPMGSPLSIPRSQGLAVAWSGAPNRNVRVSVSTTQTNVRSVSIACAFPGAQGSATVPAAAMGKLLATSGAVLGYVLVDAPVQNQFQAGAWQITFALASGGWSHAFTTSN